jgi:hypothetical protein
MQRRFVNRFFSKLSRLDTAQTLSSDTVLVMQWTDLFDIASVCYSGVLIAGVRPAYPCRTDA